MANPTELGIVPQPPQSEVVFIFSILSYFCTLPVISIQTEIDLLIAFLFDVEFSEIVGLENRFLSSNFLQKKYFLADRQRTIQSISIYGIVKIQKDFDCHVRNSEAPGLVLRYRNRNTRINVIETLDTIYHFLKIILSRHWLVYIHSFRFKSILLTWNVVIR